MFSWDITREHGWLQTVTTSILAPRPDSIIPGPTTYLLAPRPGEELTGVLPVVITFLLEDMPEQPQQPGSITFLSDTMLTQVPPPQHMILDLDMTLLSFYRGIWPEVVNGSEPTMFSELIISKNLRQVPGSQFRMTYL